MLDATAKNDTLSYRITFPLTATATAKGNVFGAPQWTAAGTWTAMRSKCTAKDTLP